MRIGAPVPSTIIKQFKITHLNIANGKEVPVFFSKLHNTSKKSNVTAEQASLLWNYLENTPGVVFNRDKFRPEYVFGLTELILTPLREAVAESAGVLGQILNHNTNKTIHEMLFFIVSYFNEIAMSEPTDMISFTTKCGIDLAKYIEALNPQKLDIDRVKTPLNKSVWEIIDWLKGMLKSNYLVVHEAFSALLGITMENITFKIHSLCGTFMKDLEQPFTPIEKLKEVAQNLSKLEGIPKTNQTRLQTALEQVKILETANKPRSIQPWMLASIMRQMYYNEPIDKKIANLMVFDRTGKTMKEYMTEFDYTLSILKAEIWLAIISLSSTLDKPTLKSYITQYASISMRRNWWFSGEDDDEDEEKKKKDDDPKGKEEATAEDDEEKKRRVARMAEDAKLEHLKHIAKLKAEHQAELEKAMRNDPDNPYNPLLNSDERIEQTRVRVKRRLAELIERITERFVELTHVERVVKSNNLSTRIEAGNTAIAQFRGSLEHHKTITDALHVVDTLLTENVQIVQEELMPYHFELDLLNGILNALDRQEEALNGRVYATSIKWGVFLMIIAGIFGILYFISKSDSAWIGEVNRSLKEAKDRATATYTRGLVNMCENVWIKGVEKVRSSSILGNWTPLSWLPEYNMNVDTIKDVFSESLRRLGTYVSEIVAPVSETREAFLSILNKYTDFMVPYVNGLNTLLAETIVHYNELVKKGHILESSEQLQRVAGLRVMIEKALSGYKDITTLPSQSSTTYQIIQEKIISVNNAFSEALQALQIKMMEGALPESINIYTRITNGLLEPMGILKWSANQIMYLFKRIDELRRGTTPQPYDMSPDRMMNLVGAGKSPQWMDAWKDVGKGTIAVGVFTAAFPLLVIFNITNLWSRLYHTGGNPLNISIKFFFQAIGSMFILVDHVAELLKRANVANYELSWSLFGSFFGLLAMFIPSLVIFQTIQKSIRDKLSKTPSGVEVVPIRPQTPNPNAAPRPTPKLNTNPTTIDPDVFKIPESRRIEPPTIDLQQIKDASVSWLEALKKKQAEKRAAQADRGGWVDDEKESKKNNKDDDDDDNFTIEKRYVECVVCGEEAKLMCSHCHEKSYCNGDCGKYDWSSHNNHHVSFIKK